MSLRINKEPKYLQPVDSFGWNGLTFVWTRHFLSLGSGIFDFNGIIQQKSLLLFKKLINLLQKESKKTDISWHETEHCCLVLISIKTHPQRVDWHTDLDPWDEDLISTLYHVLKEPAKHFLGIFPPYAELNNKWEEDYRVKHNMNQSEGRTIVRTLYHHWLRSKEVTCLCYQYNWHLSVQYKTYGLWLEFKDIFFDI